MGASRESSLSALDDASVASRAPTGSASTSLGKRSERYAERDMPAARVAHQVQRSWLELFDEGDHVGDMLRHLVVVAHAIPIFRKEMPQRDCDNSVMLRQRPHNGPEGAEIAERAVHANKGPALAELEICHVVAIDA